MNENSNEKNETLCYTENGTLLYSPRGIVRQMSLQPMRIVIKLSGYCNGSLAMVQLCSPDFTYRADLLQEWINKDCFGLDLRMFTMGGTIVSPVGDWIFPNRLYQPFNKATKQILQKVSSFVQTPPRLVSTLNLVWSGRSMGEIDQKQALGILERGYR